MFGAELADDLGPRYVPVTRSPTPVPGTRPGRFHVGQVVDDPAARYFICGSPRFVDGVRADLLAAGVSRTRVHTERFDS
ncbi:hypothetical protein FHX44_116486 [Pseudonocardia hierapolitana]|uniref:Uncharacterized protein n=1 Tax=Pseudonocardia hierapolitana TaxID=1128676 RepID=A0A561T0B1_9PSEU|nr:hypothetical protein FHX44_116486 [Pseudonocardia hierapolitana]